MTTDAAPTELIAYPIRNYKHGAPTEREAELGSLWKIVFVNQLNCMTSKITRCQGREDE